MARPIVPVICLVVTAGCSPGVATGHVRPTPAPTSRRSVRTGPGSCNDAIVSSIGGKQNETVRATTGAPLTLGARLDGVSIGTRRFESLRIDVLPGGQARPASFSETGLLTGEEPHVRRFVASDAQLGGRAISFLFDGRDDDGAVLPAGSYQVGMVALTRAMADCDDPLPGAVYGQLTTVDWQPNG